VRTWGVSATDASTPTDAGPTPVAVRTAESSRYARIYSGTSPKPVKADGPELQGVCARRLQQLGNQRFLFFQLLH